MSDIPHPARRARRGCDAEAAGSRAVAAAAALLAIGCGGGATGADTDAPGGAASSQERRSGLRRAAVPEVEGQRRDDGMQVEGLRGTLTAYQIQMGIRPHQRELSRCYADGARYDFIGGEIVFVFDVAVDGTVLAPARIESSELGSWAIERCLLDVVRRMTFESPGDGEATVTMPLEFDAREPAGTWGAERADEELEAPPSLPPAADEEEARRRRERRRRRRIRARRAGEEFDEPASKREDLARCAQEGGAGPPDGVRITVYIDRRGRVQSAGFAAAGTIDEAWAECAASRIEAWRMSALETPGVRVARFEFPF